ncbi:CinA family protein [Campylobacter hyointestinalis]|uniref:CinA family protein n=1 Tax=Campylobacter hyointestinalis subsp. lawsonii TaxID=91353 RepID=A0AAV6EGB6_CAMHY|nr:CinA family protein [Campylobacter hyointestinalis]KAB0614136.1 CinA family protein [Campylobacter hyointestinalis subsp. lawsonii]QKF69876.1 NMN amidohydrolase [Campylobacter hyointestinalis subsp. lawsonii]RAZ29843.1 CinA family protein [Campylobacter hyointestinalis subsp. lawsonii]RAZ56119.1 CinA family protein [Campylobacter hyointestinalis subsp. lawsonii]RAZ62882.1 CinA family protein [Campylobacter hyointestinalis subsp. lawsonii]
MKHIILIVGEELQINKPFLDYVFRKYENYVGELGMISYAGGGDKELPFYIENISKNYECITIIANDSNFYTLSKILATLSIDTIELKEDTLIPSRAINYAKNSFLLTLNTASINLIKATPTKELPSFLQNTKQDSKFFHILGVDKESAKILLEPLSTTYNVNISLTELLPGLTYAKVSANRYGQIDGFLESVSNLFTGKMINEKDIVVFVAKKLIQKNLKITFAESCTSGLCAAKLGSVSGVSSVFDGSVVTYANSIKHSWIDVSDEVLQNFGAVSDECVRQMVLGAIKLCSCDFAIAISGIAGPDGGSEQKPVGTVYIAVTNKNGEIYTQRLSLNGDRDYIREQSALHAYALLLRSYPSLLE